MNRDRGVALDHHLGSVVTGLRLATLVLTLVFGAQVQGQASCKPTSSKMVYWGDLHVHTAYSMDAYVFNNQRTPSQAYAFAQGATEVTDSGVQVQLQRPLDFAAVTDHAEYFGLMNYCQRQQPQQPYCQELRQAASENSPRGFREYFLPILLRGDRNCLDGEAACDAAEQDLWQATIEAANQAYKPCEFTTFVANEWTASPDNLHWHRNLIYRSDQVPTKALNSFDQPTQEELWRALQSQCDDVPGCDVLAIPHNSNLGMGGSFRVDPQDTQSLKLRAKFEKLVEIHQHKGQSECYAGSPLADDECGFENMLPIPLLTTLAANPRPVTEAEHEQVRRGYVRDTLGFGLTLAQLTGTNPFQYGFIASTDSHAARPGYVDEAQWQGHLGGYDEPLERRKAVAPLYNPGGLVAVWANANTREALFDSMANRETYATSGPRIQLRFDVSLAKRVLCDALPSDLRPMGSTLDQRLRKSAAPTFVVQALKDQVPLQRVDVVKLVYRDGELQQQVRSWHSGGDKAGGRSDWCLTWQDAEFSTDEPALWYTRVLQQPTPRWDGLTQIRERAWSSPIWYFPRSS